jgi:hypothetical protein
VKFRPGGVAGGRDVECFIYFGGKEPDCVLELFFRVSFVKLDGSVVI